MSSSEVCAELGLVTATTPSCAPAAKALREHGADIVVGDLAELLDAA